MFEDAYPTPAASDAATAAGAALAAFISSHRRLLVISGAGCSTESGIPDYRDAHGGWKRRPPITGQLFLHDAAARRRYWARSQLGWPHIAEARPNAAHRALATLESRGTVETLVTQNVDGLHQAAGSQGVIDLHGRIDRVVCVACGAHVHRSAFQSQMLALNASWADLRADTAPDGDADIEADFENFRVPDCGVCGALLRPDVVFFGENVPRERVESAFAALSRADALLVVGSSLMVYSGYRFAQAAAAAGLPIAAVNLGRTRADALLSLKLEQPAGATLSAALAAL